MRNLRWVLILIVLISCTKKIHNNKTKGDFDFLIGTWERTNSKDGEETYEYWKIISSSEYNGQGYTLSNRDTIFKERMKLLRKDTVWKLEVSRPNENPVIFKLTTVTKKSFIASNPKHDFPKQISYSYFDDTITVKLSNDEMKIPRIFWRIEK